MKHKFLKKLLVSFILLISSIPMSGKINIYSTSYIYLDPVDAGWDYSYMYVALGGDNNSWAQLKKVSVVNSSNSKLYYVGATDCTNADWFCAFATSSDWGSEGKNYDNMAGYGSMITAQYRTAFDFNNGNVTMVTPANTTKYGGITVTYKGISYTALNFNNTVGVKVKAAGASSYTAPSTSPGAVKGKAYSFSAYGTCTSADEKSLSGSTVSQTFKGSYRGKTTFSAPTITGYTFKGWYNGSGTQQYTDAEITIYPTAATTLYAYYEENTYSISASANPSAGGTVTPTTATAMGQISGGNITATNNPGYHFVNWTLGTAAGTFGSSTTASTTFKPTNEGTIVANFAANEYAITYNGEHISSYTDKVENGTYNTTITVKPVAAQDYAVDGIVVTKTEDGSAVSTDYESPYTFTQPAFPVTVTVQTHSTAVTTYTIRFLNDNGTVLQTGLVEEGNTPVYSGATPTKPSDAEWDYTFNGWNPTIVEATEDADYTATYSSSRRKYTLTWDYAGGSVVSEGTPAGQVANADAITAPTVERDGYEFTGWNPSVPATMPAANSTYTAQWTEVLYDVTINTSDEDGATLKIEGVDAEWGTTVQVGYETKKNITVTPNPGYKLNAFNVSDGGRVSGSGTDFTVSAAGADGTVTANPVTTPTIFFDNTNANWSNVYVYLMKQDAWNKTQGGKGGVAIGAYVQEYHQMTQIGTSKIYYCSYTTASPTEYVAFSDADMHSWGEFYGNNGAYRGDFADCQPMFIPDGTHSETNTTQYYNSGRWTSYSTKSEIYMVGIDDDWSERAQYQFEKETITGTSYTLDVTLSEIGHNYTFKLRKCGDGEWYGVAKNETAITSNHCTDIQFFGGNDYANCTLISTVAGTYTFTYDITTKKLSVEYPAMPAPASINVTAERYFGEEKIDNFIATDPAYKVYTDEKIVLTIAAVAAPTGCTTYYQFGENAASTERTYIISNITNIASSIDAKVFFRPNAGGKDGDAKSETINYIGVFAPSINLTTSWKDHNEEAQEGVDVPDDVTIYYNAANYIGSAIVTRKQDNLEPETFMTIASGEQANKTYTLENQNVQRQTFVATATVNGRTFTATKSISVYRLVEITITDANNLMANYYMWEDGTNPTRKEAEWPGNSFFSTLGNAHIFYVKYPSYTHFVLNNGRQAGEGDAIQTVNIELPNQSTCYTIGEQIAEEGENKGKYNVEIAQTCPNKLYVGDIAPVAALQGEGVLVSPQVDIDPLLNADDLRITFNYKSATGITCDQRGRNFMVTATSTGTKSISVTYSIDGANHVTKDVTVNVTSAIMVQVKVPTSFNWNDHNDMWVYYFGHGAEGHIRMSWKDCVGSHDRFSARVPLGTDDNKVNFLFHEWTLDGKKPWQQTTDITDVTTDGCYTLKHVKDGDKRGYEREDENCWTEYYVEIDMNSGTVYRSNKVEDLANTVSFYAPTSDKGSIRIMQNGTQKTVISPSDHQTLFATAGVYTAKITTDGTGLSDVTPYTGDYYIRTDAATTTASGDDFSDGWSNYKNDNHKFSQFTLFDDALYDYYWVNNCKRTKGDGKLNIKGCVANDYNDNLANMIESDTYTDDDGFLQGNNSTGINLRFGYNPATNYFERAALTGSTSEGGKFLNIIGENVYNKQNRQEELNETNYNDHPDYSKMEDDGDWIYEKTVFVNIDPDHSSSQIYLKSLINSKELYQLGYKTDNFGRKTSELKKRTIMGQGSSNGEYALRIVYDFKQNRILSSWSPIGELKVTKDLMINADVMFIRHENGGTAHIIFENKSAKVTSLQNVYFVLELDKYVGEENERNYWFTVPFDVKVGDIFGVENYVTLDADNEAIDGSWGILRYDGYTRSKKGWFIEDTPEGFWEWMDKDEVLTAGTGYVLVFDKKDFEWKEFDEVIPCDDPEDEQCIDGKKTIKHAIKRIYFPSQAKGFSMSNASENPITYADESCTITKPVDRTKEDSNWKVIGPMSYNDIKVAASDVDTYNDGKDWPNFLYLYDENKEKGSRYIPTQGYGDGFTYQAFHGYMTQYAGTIIWRDMSVTNPSSAPRFAEEPEFKGGTMTIELVQNNEQLDRTFVKLSKNGTEGFDQNLDLMKITDKCAQIASVSEDALYAGNTLPLDIEMVPLNVKVVANGTYDIALVQSLEGLEVRLLDAFEQTTTVLDMMPATVTLNKGEYKDRFFLQFVQKSPLTPTNFNGTIDQFNLPTDKTQKLLINDNIYLINGGRIYNVLGARP